ncbi:MAG TPA: glycosyltransferase, partial [Armatimonadota bacterium]|nr:glycosyltransferase [Armatimonadota bacterium]
MRLSIIIVNWNTSKLLETCLESIYRNPPAFNFEVVVVDNASSDFNPKEMAEKFKQTVFIVNSENLGYAEGNNQAIKAVSGDYVLLLNPDTEVKNDALTVL